jgi:pre-mRNA-splicing factor 18
MSSLSSLKNLVSNKKPRAFKTRGQLEEEKKREQEPIAKKHKAGGMELYERPETAPSPASDSAAAASPGAGEELPPREEVMRALRGHSQPVTLFGETDAARAARLRHVESLVSDVLVTNQNVFAQAMEQLQADERTDPDLLALEKLVPPPESAAGMEGELLTHFLTLLKMGGEELAARPPEEAKTINGKKEKAIWKQTLVYILPLFRKLAARTLEREILNTLAKVMQHVKAREYAEADNAYLLLAIGNAAWPMGVTSVGIHERAAREKISSGGEAHVLNDEVQRKYIQSVKRLITFSAKHFPNNAAAVSW